MRSVKWTHLLLVAGLLLGSAPAQDAAPEKAKPTVVILGASVSAGFGVDQRRGDRTIRLARACRELWPDTRARVVDCAEGMTFANPRSSANRSVSRALREKPDLVIGVDFLFWFGYGKAPAGTPEKRAAQRLRMLEQGLEFLEEFDCPMIVGDYPDMDGADPRYLQPWMVPEPEVLVQLNERLAAWAAERPRVQVMPLAQWVTDVKAGQERIVFGKREISLGPEVLLQDDRLHATRLGVCLLAHRLVPLVRKAFAPEHPLLHDVPELGELIEQLGADRALPSLEGGEALDGAGERRDRSRD